MKFKGAFGMLAALDLRDMRQLIRRMPAGGDWRAPRRERGAFRGAVRPNISRHSTTTVPHNGAAFVYPGRRARP